MSIVVTDPSQQQPLTRPPLAVSPREACRLLSIGTTYLYELLRTGELQSYLCGRARRITVASINTYIARRLEAAGATGAGAPQPCRKRGRPRKVAP